jgi:hypothetical protein
MAKTQTFAVSFALGSILFVLTLFLGWLSTSIQVKFSYLTWMLLPVLAYGLALGVNSGVQAASCGSVKIGQIALGALVVPVTVLIGLTLTLSSFVRSAVSVAVPLSMRQMYGDVVAVGFYMFWAGMFGEAFSGGFATSCG